MPARIGRVALNGLVFGGLAVTLAIARIQVAPGVYFDARNVPVALIALFEGGPTGAVAAAVVAVYRWWWLGGPGTIPGIVSVAAAAAAGALVHWSAKRYGRVRNRHAFLLGFATLLTTFLGYSMLGARGVRVFAGTWLYFVITYVVGIGLLARLFEDVVERERLQAAERRFRAIIDEASEAIRIVDPASMRIIETNRMDCELSGYSREEMIGRDVREFWPDDPEGRAERERVVAESRARGFARAFGLRVRTRSGTVITVDYTRRVVQHGGRTYEIVIYRDATEREAADAARREVLDLRAIALVANGAAHEINNPLTVIVGSLELIARKLTPEAPEMKWIDRAVTASQRIRDIIARMTKITRVEASASTGGVPPMLDIRKSSDVH